MSKYTLGIFFASWEPRFHLGIKEDLKTATFKEVVIFYSEEYGGWTESARAIASELFANANVPYKFVGLYHTRPSECWKTITDVVESQSGNQGAVLVNFSTMPRDVLWACLSSLRTHHQHIDYVYHKPDGYGDWLSADPVKPRMLYRHSGVASLEKPLAVIATTGYDFDRTVLLYTTFEPAILGLAIQVGGQFENPEKNIKEHLGWATGKRGSGVTTLDVDAYCPDHGQELIRQALLPILESHNIILASLGPKPSAIAMYKLWVEYPAVALVYTPCLSYNRSYSHGLGEFVSGSI